jgi:ribonucleoside-diphosphate reductase alpha chain
MQYGPQSAFSDGLHAEKYRSPGESYRECATRVSHALSDTELHFRQLRDIMGNMRYLFGGRIQSAMGSLKATTAYNCFVSGTIADSFVEGEGSIMARATQAATTMRMGGGIGYDFSTLRPRNALIRKLQSASSGPVAFMDIFNSICRVTSSAGNRRGAQMGVLRVDHPDIEEFIRAKQNTTALRGFNISVAVTDEFMRAVKSGSPFPLRFDGQIYSSVDARDLWEMLMRSTYDWAEPGVIFIDRVNEMNNLHYCETIAATNPCGEQPLPPFGACLLGSMNLVKYMTRESPLSTWGFDYERFHLDIEPVVRAMDNVIDKARYPLAEQEREAQAKRRMGIGITGAANAIEAMGHPYGTPGFVRTLGSIMQTLRDAAYRASVKLAQEKGPFKEFRPAYLDSEFIQTLPEDIQDEIRTHGIRNSHLLSIAPTGTISLTADNVSSGIEPVFAYSTTRTILRTTGPSTETIPDYGVTYLGHKGKVSDDCTVADHLAVLKVASKYVDSAVSKTCNVPKNIEWDDFKDIYFQAWEAGCKGCTTYRKGGKLEPVMATTEESLSCSIDPNTGERSCE